MAIVKLGVFPYLNALPLTCFLDQALGACQTYVDLPSHTAAWVRSGRTDVALVPTIDVLETPELEAIEGIGICADGPVASVLLRCHKPLSTLRTLRPDPASRSRMQRLSHLP